MQKKKKKTHTEKNHNVPSECQIMSKTSKIQVSFPNFPHIYVNGGLRLLFLAVTVNL